MTVTDSGPCLFPPDLCANRRAHDRLTRDFSEWGWGRGGE